MQRFVSQCETANIIKDLASPQIALHLRGGKAIDHPIVSVVVFYELVIIRFGSARAV